MVYHNGPDVWTDNEQYMKKYRAYGKKEKHERDEKHENVIKEHVVFYKKVPQCAELFIFTNLIVAFSQFVQFIIWDQQTF